MQSLDDLELEHESGGIDDESYAELHDDYTARAAGVIRTLRDGVDVTAPPPPRSPQRTRRRVLLVSVVLVFAIAVGTSLAYALGARLPGQTSSGNSAAAPSTTNAAQAALSKKIDDLQAKVNAAPDDYDLRLAALARVRGERRRAERAEAVGRRDRDRREPSRRARELGAPPLSRVGGHARPIGEEHADRAGVGRVQPGHHRRARLRRQLLLPRRVVLAVVARPREGAGRPAELPGEGAERDVGRARRASCSRRSRQHSKALRLRCLRRPPPRRSRPQESRQQESRVEPWRSLPRSRSTPTRSTA